MNSVPAATWPWVKLYIRWVAEQWQAVKRQLLTEAGVEPGRIQGCGPCGTGGSRVDANMTLLGMGEG